MREVLLVRHASTSWSGRRYCGTSDPPLDDAGRAAAAALAGDLVDAVGARTRLVSSPAARARETAQAIARVAGIASMEVDDRWREVDFGIAEGRTFDELRELDRDLAASILAGAAVIDWPGGESGADFAARVGAAWSSVSSPTGQTLVVSHAGPIRLATSIARGLSPTDIEPPALCSVTRLSTGDA